MAAVGRFQDEWKLLKRGLRRRAMLRAALVGGAIGSIAAAALVIIFVSSAAAQAWFEGTARSWSGTDEATSEWARRLLPTGFLVLPMLLAAFGAVLARMARYRDEVAAAWADVHGGGADSVRTALSEPLTFRNEIQSRAATVVSHARTSSVRIRGSGALGSVVIVISVIAVGVAAWFESKRLSEDPAGSPAGEVAAALMRPFAGLVGGANSTDLLRLAEWAKGMDFGGIGAGAQQVARLEELLENGGLTEGEALSELSRIQSALESETGGAVGAAAIQALLERPEALELAKRFLGSEAAADAAESVMEAIQGADPATLGELQKAVSRVGGETAEADPQRQGESVTKRLVDGLSKLVRDSPLAGRLLGGQIDRERAAGALRATEALRTRSDELRQMVLRQGQEGGGSDSGQAQAPKQRFEVLLKDLPPVPRGGGTREAGSETSGIGGTALVPTTGRSLEASAADYRSRGHRIPRDLRDAAARYFGGEQGGR